MSYNIIFIWLLVVGLFYQSISHQQMNANRRMRWEIAIVAFLPIFYIVVFTILKTGDMNSYILSYKSLPTNLEGTLIYLNNCDDSYLFWVLLILIKKLSGGSILAFRVIIALLQSIPIIYIYKKYSTNYLLSIFLFVAAGIPMAWMMNGIRQFTAVVMIFAATPLMLEKKYVRLIIVIILATFFHQTAIIMLPIVFIAQGQLWNNKTIVLIILSIIAVYVFVNNIGVYQNLIGSIGYSSELYAEDNGTSPLRVLVNFIPVLLSFIGRNDLRQENNKIINLATNMSIIAFGIYFISMVTSGILIGRVPIYMSLYNFILLPYLIKYLFTYESYKITYCLLIGFYYLYFYVQYM